MSLSENSKETVEQLIKDAFHRVDFSMEFIYQEASRLIQTAEELELNELVTELKNDLK